MNDYDVARMDDILWHVHTGRGQTMAISMLHGTWYTALPRIEARVLISFPAAETQAFKWGRPLIDINGGGAYLVYEFNTPGL